jgi:hypothetical protein
MALKQGKVLLHNFLWGGGELTTITKICWGDVCAPRMVGGFSIMNP